MLYQRKNLKAEDTAEMEPDKHKKINQEKESVVSAPTKV